MEKLIQKKTIINKFHDLFIQFVSLFIKKEKTLPEANAELTEELKAVEEKYQKLISSESFDNLKNTYDLYKISPGANGGLVAVERNTGYVKDDPKFVSRVRFVLLWRKSAYANIDNTNEEECYKECFSNESLGIFQELKDIVEKQLKKTGNIDTKEILDNMKESTFKWGRVTSRRLFKTKAYSDTVNDYFRSIIKTSKKQTKPTLSLSEALYDGEIE